MFLIFILINLIFSSKEFIKDNCSSYELDNYNAFIDKVYSLEVKDSNCVNKDLEKEVKLTNLFNDLHKVLFLSLYNVYDVNALPLASNVCEALDKKHKPSSLHYAYLLNTSFSYKNYDFRYFKIKNDYGIYYKDKILTLFWSIISHTLEKGFGCNIEEFLKITNNTLNKDGVIYLDNIYPSLEIELAKKTSFVFVEEEVKEKTFFIDSDNLIDNSSISIYTEQNNEIIDNNLRAIINTYFIKDIGNIIACFNNKKTDSILLNFDIVNSKFVFKDINNSILENYCLENLFNSNLSVYISGSINLKILALFNLNLI